MTARQDEASGQGWLQGAAGKNDIPNATPLATSRSLFDKADAISASIPFLMTRERKRETILLLCGLWLSALSVAREVS